MASKFDRQYRITIDPKDKKPPIVITRPFTIDFSVQRGTAASINFLSLSIYNLSEENRSRIYQDRNDIGKDRTITFEAGYETLYLLFSGFLYSASSAREGTNIITEIEARTGQFPLSATQTFQTLQSGQTIGDVIKFLCGELNETQQLPLGAVGEYPDKINRPVVLNGNTWELLKTYANGNVFVDNGKVFVLRPSEVLENSKIVINDATGLLDTPRRQAGLLSINMLLEPSANCSQIVEIKSTVQKNYDGEYKILGVYHNGTISSAVSGRATTTLVLQAPNFFKNFTTVRQLA